MPVTNRFLRIFLGTNYPVYHGIVLAVALYVAVVVTLIARKLGVL
jgi:hypothetical protein